MSSNQNIVDRVVERIKKQPLGDLITDEDLYDIVKEAIPKAFFEPRSVVVQGSYRNETKTVEPAIVEVLRDHLRASVDKQIGEWVINNGALIAEHWKKVTDDGLLAYVQKRTDELATAQLRSALKPIIDQLNQERMQKGMAPVYV